MSKETASKSPFVPVAEPALVGNERKYVLDCIDSSWISSAGTYVERFESAFAQFCEVPHAAACSNGTVALHLALRALEVSPGDEVIVPAMTFVATANAVTYCGATPIFADSLPDTWNLDPSHVEALVNPRTRGIIAVHLFGLPAEMDALRRIADLNGLFLIEDAAEAHGAQYKKQTVGSLGDLATFSFYGNKILTTGEGGMVTTQDAEIDRRVRRLKGQGMDPERRYWFPELGYNYRLTNVAAAIGLAQLEKVDWHLQRRQEVAKKYYELLSNDSRFSFQHVPTDCDHVYWMTSVLIHGVDGDARDAIRESMARRGIETRPFFPPMHRLPMYEAEGQAPLPIAEDLGNRGLSLPSGPLLDTGDQVRVCDALTESLDEYA